MDFRRSSVSNVVLLSLLTVGNAIVYKNKAVKSAREREREGDSFAAKTVPAFGNRDSLGSLLDKEGLTTGAELGVQAGLFSKTTLEQWPSCASYLLVDIWAHQDNYDDHANVADTSQEQRYQATLSNTNPWQEKIHVCRNYTTNCVKQVADNSLDYVYVDARHDYKGVSLDLNDWWPKVRPGGILAGHDFVDAAFVAAHGGSDWALNYDGTRDPQGRAVKGAVVEFAKQVSRNLTIGTDMWPSWALRK